MGLDFSLLFSNIIFAIPLAHAWMSYGVVHPAVKYYLDIQKGKSYHLCFMPYLNSVVKTQEGPDRANLVISCLTHGAN